MNSRFQPLRDAVGERGLFADGDWIESKDQDPHGDVRLIQLADIGDGVYLNKSRRFLTSTRARELSCTFLQPGDILVARMPEPLGRACIFPGDQRPAVTAVDVCIIRPEEHVNRVWLTAMLNAPQTRRAIERLQRGTTRKRISRRNLATVLIPVAARAEQNRIVTEVEKHLTRLDAAVANLRAVQAKLKAYRTEVLNGTGRLPNSAAQATSAWTVVLLKDLMAADPQNGLYLPKSAYGTGHPILRIDDYQVDRAPDIQQLRRVRTEADNVRRYALREGDLVINRVNSPSHLGKALLVRRELVGALFESNMMRVPLAPDVNGEFVEMYLHSRIGRARLTSNAKWAVNQASINQKDVSLTPVPLPPPEQQEAIVEEVRSRLASAARLHADVAHVLSLGHTLRSSVLTAAFRGELWPQ